MQPAGTFLTFRKVTEIKTFLNIYFKMDICRKMKSIGHQVHQTLLVYRKGNLEFCDAMKDDDRSAASLRKYMFG